MPPTNVHRSEWTALMAIGIVANRSALSKRLATHDAAKATGIPLIDILSYDILVKILLALAEDDVYSLVLFSACSISTMILFGSTSRVGKQLPMDCAMAGVLRGLVAHACCETVESVPRLLSELQMLLATWKFVSTNTLHTFDKSMVRMYKKICKRTGFSGSVDEQVHPQETFLMYSADEPIAIKKVERYNGTYEWALEDMTQTHHRGGIPFQSCVRRRRRTVQPADDTRMHAPLGNRIGFSEEALTMIKVGGDDGLFVEVGTFRVFGVVRLTRRQLDGDVGLFDRFVPDNIPEFSSDIWGSCAMMILTGNRPIVIAVVQGSHQIDAVDAYDIQTNALLPDMRYWGATISFFYTSSNFTHNDDVSIPSRRFVSPIDSWLSTDDNSNPFSDLNLAYVVVSSFFCTDTAFCEWLVYKESPSSDPLERDVFSNLVFASRLFRIDGETGSIHPTPFTKVRIDLRALFNALTMPTDSNSFRSQESETTFLPSCEHDGSRLCFVLPFEFTRRVRDSRNRPMVDVISCYAMCFVDVYNAAASFSMRLISLDGHRFGHVRAMVTTPSLRFAIVTTKHAVHFIDCVCPETPIRTYKSSASSQPRISFGSRTFVVDLECTRFCFSRDKQNSSGFD